MKPIIPTTLLVLTGLLAQADIVYNVTFEDPPHVVGQEPATGIGSDRPFDTQLVTIDNGIAGFTGQSATLTSDGVNAFASFSPGITFTTGIHSISWDAAILTLDASDSLQVNSRIDFSDVGSLNINMLLFNNQIAVNDPQGGTSDDVIIGSWVVGQVQHFLALLDLDTDTYSVYLDGAPVVENDDLTPGDGIVSAGFQRPFVTSEFGIDNFRWEIIPEPSSLFLLLCGVSVLMGWRRRHAGA